MPELISPNNLIKSYNQGDKFLINPKFTAQAWEESYARLGEMLAEIDDGRMLMVVGLPSSGKTTFIENHAEELEDYDVIFDGGFPSKIGRSAVTNIAKGAGWEVDALYLDTPYNVCRNRNHRNANGQRIPFEAFKLVARSFSEPKSIEGFNSIRRVSGTSSRQSAAGLEAG